MTGWPARFNDGQTAAQHDVTVELSARTLIVRDAAGIELARWPVDGIALLDEPNPARPVRLRLRDEPARLTIEGEGAWTALVEAAPHLKGGFADRRIWRNLALWSVGIAAFVGLVAIGVPRFASVIAALIPVSWEEGLGRATLDRFLFLFSGGSSKEEILCETADGRAALDRLTARLADTIDTPYRFTISVADIDMVNAFALPGGYIVLFRGLLEQAESFDEVAGVLAHEMGHVTAHHAAEATIRQLGYDMLFEAVSGGSSGLDAAARIGEMLVTMSFSREAEEQADKTALAVLADAGIRSDGMARLFERLAKEHPKNEGILGYLSTHPASEDRARMAGAQAGAGDDAMGADDWHALKTMCGEEE